MDADTRINLNCSRPELEGFQDYYEQQMYPTLVKLEEQREIAIKEVTKYAIIALGLFIVAAVIYYVLGLTIHQENTNIFIIIVVAYGLVASIYVMKPLSQVKSEANNFLMNKVCSYLNIKYSRKAADFPFCIFKDAGLLPFSFSLLP